MTGASSAEIARELKTINPAIEEIISEKLKSRNPPLDDTEIWYA